MSEDENEFVPSNETGDELLAEADALIAHAESTLAAIERALEQIEGGGYGLCELCGAAIEPSILEAQPTARRCSAHRS